MWRSRVGRSVAGAAVLGLAAFGLLPVGGATAGASGSGFSFTNFEPAGLASFGLNEGGGAVGTSCPGAGAKCFNTAAEPAIRAGGDGNFYASSENGLGAGTEAWKSTDGGRHYATLPSPDALSASNNTGLSPSGGDTDLAIADDKSAGQSAYNVYVASLSLANINVSTSTDGGKSFQTNPAAAIVPGDDREWVAADDAGEQLPVGVLKGQKVCDSYHDVSTDNINVDCSYTGGVPPGTGSAFTQHASAIDAAHAYLIDNNEIGNLAIAHDVYEGDGTHGNHNIYQVFSGIGSAAEAVGTTEHFHVVWIGVSTDGGTTFTDYPVYRGPAGKDYGHQFVNISVDRKGNLYVVYTDNHNMFYSYSRNQGQSWSGPYQINRSPANTAIFPWSVAGDNGKLDVVYYGTSYYQPGQVPDNYPTSATWHAYLAQNLNVFGAPKNFTQVSATPVIHHGGVCEGGISCTGNNQQNRDLFDDFGVAASPTTGLASIVYSDDQFRAGNANNPNPPACTAGTTNTGSCDHTAFATQLTGPGIYAPSNP